MRRREREQSCDIGGKWIRGKEYNSVQEKREDRQSRWTYEVLFLKHFSLHYLTFLLRDEVRCRVNS